MPAFKARHLTPSLLRLPLLALALVAGRPGLAAAQDRPVAPIASYDAAWSAISRTYWDTLLVQGRWHAAYDSIRASLLADADADRVRGAIRALIAVPGLSHFTLIPGAAVPLPRAKAAAPSGGRAATAGATAGATAAATAGTTAGATTGASGDEAADESAPRPGTLGVVVRSIGDTLVAWRVAPDGPAARAGLRAGDVITALDTLAIDSLRAQLLRESDADAATRRRLVTTYVLARLAGDVGDTTRIGYRDAAGHTRTAALAREPITGSLTQMGNLPPMVVSASRDSVGLGRGRYATVLTFSAWLPAIAPDLDAYLFGSRHADGLIIDLRGNPGGVVGMVSGVSGHLLDTAISLGTMHGRGATIRFVANPRRVDRAGTRVGTFTGPVAILVDGFTGSTSEFFAAGMQALGRARVFGETSAGQSLPALMTRLPDGDVLMHAIADHEDATGRRVEGIGVIPDERVPLRRVDLRNGRDAALEAARAWIAAQHP